jgi:glycosyltransferase involved in cell wall biosynthesis
MSNLAQSKPIISIVCPLYNEQHMVSVFIDEVTSVLDEINLVYELICVNDGSDDHTLNELITKKNNHPSMRIINLSRNFGKEAALTAGLDASTGEVVIPIDADLQHPPELIKEFIRKWNEGYDVVLAKSIDRSVDSSAKQLTSRWFYSIYNRISDIKLPENVGDYRLMTRRVVDSLKQLPENQRFMKGIFAWVGYSSTTVEYSIGERQAGTSRFHGWMLWNLALDGLTSFSTAPIRIWLYICALVSLVSFFYGSMIVIKTVFLGVDVAGYASLMTVILFLGGIQLIGIGVLGEYIGRMYLEAKRRPVYIIENEY